METVCVRSHTCKSHLHHLLFVVDIFPVRPVGHQNRQLCAFIRGFGSVNIDSDNTLGTAFQFDFGILLEDVWERRLVDLVSFLDFELFGHCVNCVNRVAKFEQTYC